MYNNLYGSEYLITRTPKDSRISGHAHANETLSFSEEVGL